MSQVQSWYEFSDEALNMRIPGYLRPKKGIRYFAPHGRKGRDQLILGIAVDLIQSPEHAHHLRTYLEGARFVDGQGADPRLVRTGESRFVANGYESLTTRCIEATGETLHYYGALFRMNSAYIYLTINGQGEGQILEFENACGKIASSIHLKSDLVELDSPDDDELSLAEPSNTTPPSPGGAQESRSRSYLVARAKAGRRPVHSVMILSDPVTAGVRLFLLSKLKGSLLPCGSTWHETEEAAKTEAKKSMGIAEADWKIHEGEPDWGAAFLEAAENAITHYLDDKVEKRGTAEKRGT